MAKHTFFWLTGKAEILDGRDAADCLNRAGYGAGALRALDFYSKGDKTKEYSWNEKSRDWKSVNNNKKA